MRIRRVLEHSKISFGICKLVTTAKLMKLRYLRLTSEADPNEKQQHSLKTGHLAGVTLKWAWSGLFIPLAYIEIWNDISTPAHLAVPSDYDNYIYLSEGGNKLSFRSNVHVRVRVRVQHGLISLLAADSHDTKAQLMFVTS